MKAIFPLNVSLKHAIILIIFFIFSSLYSQNLRSDQNVFEKIALNDLHRYKRMIESEAGMTANQEKYDVKYYSIDLTPDPAAKILYGTVEITAEVTASSLDSIELNFWDGMSITAIHLSDFPDVQLSYSQMNDLLSVSLDSTFLQGEKIAVTVKYHGSPQNSGYKTFYLGTLNGRNLICTSDCTGILAWCPCKDTHTDKADSVDIKISVPSELIAVSNGRLRETTVHGDTTTYWWHEQYPISTLSISFAAYPYTVYYDDYLYNNNADTMKIHFYMVPEHVDQFYNYNSKVKDMITVFAGLFGEYPFIKEKYAIADIITEYVGLSGHTLASMEYTYHINRPFWQEWLINHEIAHQWWGHLVTEYSYHHIWLTVGFTTYSSAFWYEYLGGQSAANDYMMMKDMLYLGPGTVYVEDPTDLDNDVFNWNLSYAKAAWVVHMLRHTVTDTVFFDILKTYASSPLHQYGNATTEDFRNICEQICGLNLQKFFQQWIYEEYYPQYAYGWSLKQEVNGFKIKLRIDQVQKNTGLFWMPVDVKVTTNSYDTTFVVWDSLQSQNFTFFVDEKPINIELDADNWILKELDTSNPLPYPYAQNVTINNLYQRPGTDTLNVISGTANPDNHNLELTAIIETFDQNMTDSILMYDDGNHNDSTAGDGFFGGFWPVSTGEMSYNVHLKTLSQDSGYYNIVENAAEFTTFGPLVFDYIYAPEPDTLHYPGEKVSFKIALKNRGTSASAENITAKISCGDTCVSFVYPYSSSAFDNIGPGQSVLSSSVYKIRIDSDCPGNHPVKFNISISSNGYHFWSDSFYVDIQPTGITQSDASVPKKFDLKQNYPNPFNPVTSIEYQVARTSNVELSIYNLLGQKVAALVSEKQPAGSYKAAWDASGFASGVYLYKIQTDIGFSEIKKMVYIR